MAVLVTVSMLLCAFSPAILNWNEEDAFASGFDDDETIKYVSLGDSMTNAFGSIDYYYYDEEEGIDRTCLGFLQDDTYSYTVAIAENLKALYGEENVDFKQMAVGGFRSEEVRALLYDSFHQDILNGANDLNSRIDRALRAPDLPADVDTKDEFIDYFRSTLVDADIISYQYLYGIGTAISKPLLAMVEGKELPQYDFSRYVDEELLEIAEYVFNMVYGMILPYAGDALDSIPPEILQVAAKIAEGAAYGVLAHCVNFDAIMSWLFEIGHNGKVFDGTVLVVDSYNNYGGVVFNFGDMRIPFGDIIGLLFDVANIYTKYISKWSEMTYHADVDRDPDMMYHEFVNGGEPSDDSKAVFLQSVFNVMESFIGKSATAYALKDAYGLDVADLVKHDNTDNMTLFVNDFVRIYDELDYDEDLSEFLDYVFSANDIDFLGVLAAVQTDAPNIVTEVVTLLTYLRNAYANELLDVEIVANDTGGCDARLVALDGSEVAPAQSFSGIDLSFIFIAMNVMSGDNPMSHPSQKGHEYLYECVQDAAPCGDQLELNFDPAGDYKEVYFGGVFSLFDDDTGNDSDFAKTLPVILSEMDADDMAALIEADVVHIASDSGNLQFIVKEMSPVIIDLMSGKFGEYEPMDYGAYAPIIGEKLPAIIDQIREMVRPMIYSLLESYVEDDDLFKAVAIGVDRLTYAYVGSIASVFAITTMVEDSNPDAAILLYGAYNAYRGVDLVLDDETVIPVGDILDVLYDAYNYLVYQFCNVKGNVGYVDVTDATTEVTDKEMTIAELLPSLLYIDGLVPDEDVFVEGAQSWIGLENTYYEITWVTYDDVRIDIVRYGDMPMYGKVPVPAGTDSYSYEFAGWDVLVKVVTGPATYVAKYNLIPTDDAEDGSVSFDVSAFDNLESQTVVTKDWSVTIPSTIFDGLEGEVNLSVKVIDNNDVPKEVIGFVGEKKVVALELTVDGNEISDFGEEVVTVSFNYVPDEGERMDNISVFWIDVENGRTVEYPAVYDADTGIVTFDTTHFSYWYVDERTSDDDSGFDVYVTIILVVVALLCAALLRMRR